MSHEALVLPPIFVTLQSRYNPT